MSDGAMFASSAACQLFLVSWPGGRALSTGRGENAEGFYGTAASSSSAEALASGDDARAAMPAGER